jgi:hypothetical protein
MSGVPVWSLRYELCFFSDLYFHSKCFRLPADECKESPLGYRSSSFYMNGIGFDKLIETWEGILAVKDKAKIVKLTQYERLDCQGVYFRIVHFLVLEVILCSNILF